MRFRAKVGSATAEMEPDEQNGKWCVVFHYDGNKNCSIFVCNTKREAEDFCLAPSNMYSSISGIFGEGKFYRDIPDLLAGRDCEENSNVSMFRHGDLGSRREMKDVR